MITLSDILVFAVAKNACKSQLNKFISFMEDGDELSSWQTVLGNLGWLRENGLDIEQSYIEGKANGIGKVWYLNGQLYIEETYKNGELDGLYREWYENGQLSVEKTYKNGKIIS